MLRTESASSGGEESELQIEKEVRSVSEHSSLTLWYREPAQAWVEALPIGSGRLGAMVYGGYDVARLQLNEATLWSGGPREWDNPRAAELLPAVREAIFQGDYTRADALCQQMQGPFTQSYQPLGELLICPAFWPVGLLCQSLACH